jgi:hypothetical protein
LRGLVRAIGAQLLHDGAMYSLHVSGATGGAIDFTNDRTLLDSISRKLTGSALRADDVASITANDRQPNEVTYRIDTAVAALAKALTEVTRREGPPGSVVVISSALLGSAAYRERWVAAVRPLVRPEMRLYVLDPHVDGRPLDELLARGRVKLTP